MTVDISKIRQMLAAATPGPWVVTEYAIHSNIKSSGYRLIVDKNREKTRPEDADLIAKAPETIESLIGEVERQAEEIKRLRKVLEFYENEDNYHRKQKDAIFFYPAAIEDDMGQRAREALRRDTQQ